MHFSTRGMEPPRPDRCVKADVMDWRRLGLTALAAAVILLSACGGSDSAASGTDADEGVSAAADDEGGEERTTAEEAPHGAAVDDDPAAPVAPDSVYDPSAAPNLAWFSTFEPGTYRTGALGTPMSFTTTEALSTQPNGGGIFVLSDVASRAPDDRDLVFIRIGAFADPVAPNVAIDEQSGWPADDFLGWLAELHEGVLTTEPVDTAVNGFDAIRVDMELSDEVDCGYDGGSCVGFVTNHGHEIKALNKGATYRVWVVDQGDEDPLAIVAGIARDADSAWFERAAAVMDTVGFGDVAPNPVQQLVAGPNQLDVLGGVAVNAPDDLVLIEAWNGRGYAFAPIAGRPARIDFVDRPHDIGGAPLGSVDAVIAELSAAAVELIELDPVTIDGIDARVFDMANDDVGAILLRFSPLDVAEDYLGWDAPAAGRLWLIEHPDRGLLMINAKVFDDVEELLPVVTTLGEEMVESMTFTP